MRDERIQTTMNRIAALGFFCICYLLLPISGLYRMLILKQHPREFWDILAILFIGMFFLCIAYAKAGFVPQVSKGEWLTLGIVLLIGFSTLLFIMGQMHSVVDVGAMLIGFVPAMGLVIGIFHFLKRRWERREETEDEK
jgi:hypothetical protein